MNPKYPRRHWTRGKRIALVCVIFLGLAAGAAGLFLYIDMRENGSAAVEGKGLTIAQSTSAEARKFIIDEPLFGMELPPDWKVVSRQNTSIVQSITWQATKKNEENRSLTLYIDRIAPNLAVNKILPVTVQGNQMVPGDMSENCINFTSGTTSMSAPGAGHDKPAKWTGVDFICEMGSTIDNQIGVGSTAGLNQIVVTGQKGTHKYFFVYADRNIHPNNAILRDALDSFKAK